MEMQTLPLGQPSSIRGSVAPDDDESVGEDGNTYHDTLIAKQLQVIDGKCSEKSVFGSCDLEFEMKT